MKIAHVLLSSPIYFEENTINILAVENTAAFSRIVSNLYNDTEDEFTFILSDGNNILNIKNETELITDPITLDINKKKLLTKLYQDMAKTALSEDFYLKTMNCISRIDGYIQELLQDYPAAVFSEKHPDAEALIKLADIKIGSPENASLSEKLIDYISVDQRYMHTKLYIFVNLKLYLSEQDLDGLYSYVQYNKINIMLIENVVKPILPCEKLRIIDKDLCEIG